MIWFLYILTNMIWFLPCWQGFLSCDGDSGCRVIWRRHHRESHPRLAPPASATTGDLTFRHVIMNGTVWPKTFLMSHQPQTNGTFP